MNNRLTLQQRPDPKTRVNPILHPSVGTGNAYSQDMRTLVMFINDQFDEEDPFVQNFISVAREAHVYPSVSTLRRWEDLEHSHGHILPCRRSGNKFSQRLDGQDLILLALYRCIYPKATIAEVNAFLYRANFGNPMFSFYSHSQICRAETMIGLSRKRGSTTAYQAMYPVNLRKRWMYWNYRFPLGIADIPRQYIIDLDECGIFMEKTANRTYGKAYSGMRVREEGPYSKSEKWNLLLAVCGEDNFNGGDARRWANMWLEGGTTVNRMLEFVRLILQDIGHAGNGIFYVFTMDNLNSHKNIAVIALIHLYGHGVVFRAPYWAVDAPIEYIFNTIQSLIRARLYEIKNGNELVLAIYQSIQSIENFSNYFINVGFII